MFLAVQLHMYLFVVMFHLSTITNNPVNILDDISMVSRWFDSLSLVSPPHHCYWGTLTYHPFFWALHLIQFNSIKLFTIVTKSNNYNNNSTEEEDKVEQQQMRKQTIKNTNNIYIYVYCLCTTVLLLFVIIIIIIIVDTPTSCC